MQCIHFRGVRICADLYVFLSQLINFLNQEQDTLGIPVLTNSKGITRTQDCKTDTYKKFSISTISLTMH